MNELESRLTNNEISPFELEARDEDYDIYLFWPSLNSGDATFEKPFVETHQRHLSTQTQFDPVDSYAGWDTASSSPLSLTPPSDFRFRAPLRDDRAINTEATEVQGKGIREEDPLPKYSSMFKMGLLLTVRDNMRDPSFVSPVDGDSELRNTLTVQCKAWGISFATPQLQDEALEGPTNSNPDFCPDCSYMPS